MSENQCRDYSKYDDMMSEDLEEILRLDVSAPDGEDSDTELLLYIMGVLASRKNNNRAGKTAQQAWESFQQNYLPEAEVCPKHKKNGSVSKMAAPRFRRLIATAAVIALLVCIPITANAVSRGNIWNVVARWAAETFSFMTMENVVVTEPDDTYRGGDTSLQELLENSNQNPNIVPSWIPEGFNIEKIEKEIMPIQEIYRAIYLDGEKEIIIRVQSYIEGDPQKIEVNDEMIEVYESCGVEFYLFANNEQYRAVWMIDSYECYISGDLTIEELKMMIDSIGKG